MSAFFGEGWASPKEFSGLQTMADALGRLRPAQTAMPEVPRISANFRASKMTKRGFNWGNSFRKAAQDGDSHLDFRLRSEGFDGPVRTPSNTFLES